MCDCELCAGVRVMALQYQLVVAAYTYSNNHSDLSLDCFCTVLPTVSAYNIRLMQVAKKLIGQLWRKLFFILYRVC